jgi:hypothetical protein
MKHDGEKPVFANHQLLKGFQRHFQFQDAFPQIRCILNSISHNYRLLSGVVQWNTQRTMTQVPGHLLFSIIIEYGKPMVPL